MRTSLSKLDIMTWLIHIIFGICLGNIHWKHLKCVLDKVNMKDACLMCFFRFAAFRVFVRLLATCMLIHGKSVGSVAVGQGNRANPMTKRVGIPHCVCSLFWELIFVQRHLVFIWQPSNRHSQEVWVPKRLLQSLPYTF